MRISDWSSDVCSSDLGGQIGDLPISGETELNAAILTQSRFTTPEQFGNIILRANPDGSAVTLSDVARVELGAQTYLFDSELNGKRSEEHTSELQSLMRISYAVFCLKKKKNTQTANLRYHLIY